MARPSFSMDDELLEKLDSQLTYGDTRSEFVRNSIKLRLEVHEILDEGEIEVSPEEERELVVDALRKELEERE
jgi:metal-responsive CopG/Arc/MetJ family transcriptional regulator